MNLGLAAIILLVILYPVGYQLAKKESSPLISIPVLLLFLATAIYLLVSSWRLFLMMLGTGILVMGAIVFFEAASNARAGSEMEPYLRGRSKQSLFIGLILVGGSIYLFILSIIKCLE